MIRALEVPVRSALLMMIGLTIVLAGGCAMPSTEDVSSAAQSGPGALREAALEELRSIPPSQPMAGPAVPGIFTQADAAQVVGHNDFKIIAQESPS